jgi:hypothetical protein
MKWEKTTLRKGTKTPKICRDMFITDSRGYFNLCQVKNGKMVIKKPLNSHDATNLINEHKLVKTGSCFNNCFTYRDFQSAKLVRDMLA